MIIINTTKTTTDKAVDTMLDCLEISTKIEVREA